MIRKYEFQRNTYHFYNEDELKYNENIYSIIIGKNGTGKSTMLSDIVTHLCRENENLFFKNSEIGFKEFHFSYIDVTDIPRNIIAVSSSPYDKFPLPRRLGDIDNYTYLGLRDLPSLNFGLSYMVKIIASLLESLMNTPYQWNNLASVLNYLGYEDEIFGKFGMNFNRNSFEELEDTLMDQFIGKRPMLRSINKRFFIDEFGDLNKDKFEHLRYLFHTKLEDIRLNRNVEFKLSSNGLDWLRPELFDLTLEDLLFLIHAGVIRLKDIALRKKDRGSVFSISQTSSGEQSVILSILGIASKITDQSIICIDEPEICLHPEWQEKYIQLLISTFSHFRKCHFIIATHSPQIISNLNIHNCFVISMEDASINNANRFIKNSIDFQLANVFRSPGFRNEYLSRIAFTLFTKVGKNKKFDQEDLDNYQMLKSVYKLLDNTDPVKELIAVVIELYRRYA